MHRDPKTGYHAASAVELAELWKELRSMEKDPIVSSWIDDPAGDDFRTRRMVDAATSGVVIAFARPDEKTPFPWSEVEAATYAGVPVVVVGFENVDLPLGVQRFETLAEGRRRAKSILAAANHAQVSVSPEEAASWLADAQRQVVGAVEQARFVAERALAKQGLARDGESSTWEQLKAREKEILADYDRGNLTPLGVANFLRRAGFNLRYAVDVANVLSNRPVAGTHEDWVMLPSKPTPEMRSAASDIAEGFDLPGEHVLAIFDAMVSATLGRSHAQETTAEKKGALEP